MKSERGSYDARCSDSRTLLAAVGLVIDRGEYRETLGKALEMLTHSAKYQPDSVSVDEENLRIGIAALCSALARDVDRFYDQFRELEADCEDARRRFFDEEDLAQDGPARETAEILRFEPQREAPVRALVLQGPR